MGTECYPSLTRHHPPARREETEFNEFGYKIGYIHAVRRVKRKSQFLGAWDDFSFRDDQWVDEEDVKPRSKITKFYGLTASISILDRPLSLLRDGLARRMLSKVVGERRPVWEHRIEFPGLSLVEVVRPLLEWLRRPRSGKPAQIIDLDGGKFELTIPQLTHIAEAVALQAVRPEAGVGNLRIKCGGASYEDMLMLTGLKLKWNGSMLTGEITTVVFHGKTGTPTWPSANSKDKYTLAVRNLIVLHAKKILVQEWSPAPIHTHLGRKGWHALPKGAWQLPDAVAFRGAQISIPRDAWPTKSAHVEKGPVVPVGVVVN